MNTHGAVSTKRPKKEETYTVKQQKEILIAIEESNMFKHLLIPLNIATEISQFAVGCFKKCFNCHIELNINDPTQTKTAEYGYCQSRDKYCCTQNCADFIKTCNDIIKQQNCCMATQITYGLKHCANWSETGCINRACACRQCLFNTHEYQKTCIDCNTYICVECSKQDIWCQCSLCEGCVCYTCVLPTLFDQAICKRCKWSI